MSYKDEGDPYNPEAWDCHGFSVSEHLPGAAPHKGPGDESHYRFMAEHAGMDADEIAELRLEHQAELEELNAYDRAVCGWPRLPD